jgi:putative oxidoreductase
VRRSAAHWRLFVCIKLAQNVERAGSTYPQEYSPAAQPDRSMSFMSLRVIDSLVLRSEPLILLLVRVCIGSLYLMSGINHWRDLALLTHFITGLPGSVIVWAMLTATIEGACGTALVLGFCTRDFALLLLIFNLCAAAIGHPYWSITDATTRSAQFIHFWKDIGLAGGAFFVLARGAGPLSFDRG